MRFIFLALSALLAAVAVGPSLVAAQSAERTEYLSDGPDFDLRLEFARRAISRQPAILDDDATVRRWFETVYPERLGHRADGPAIAKRYYQGTPFEKQDVLNAYRATLKEQATTASLRFVRSYEATLRTDRYDASRGFPLAFPASLRLGDQPLSEIGVFIEHLGRDAVMYFDNVPDLTLVPITDEADARRISALLQENRYADLRVEAYLTLQEVGAIVLTDSYAGTDLLADARLDGMALVLPPTKNSKIRASQVIHRWTVEPAAAPANTAGMTAAEFADWAGIPLAAGRLAVNQGNDYSAYRSPEWRRIFDLAQLSAQPDLMAEDAAALYLGNLILSDREKAVVAGGKDLFSDRRQGEPSVLRGKLNEFEYAEAMKRLREEFGPEILAHRPAFPVPLVHITPTLLGDYDMEKLGFPLTYGGGAEAGASRLSGVVLRQAEGVWQAEAIETGVRELPPMLHMPTELARELVEILESRQTVHNKRLFFLAEFATLEAPAPGTIGMGYRKGEPALMFDASPHRMAYFADPGLHYLIGDIDIPDGWKADGLNQDFADAVPVADAESVELWLTKQDPARLDNGDAVRTALEARRLIEAESRPYLTDLAPVLPAALVKQAEEPRPQDLDTFREFYRRAAETVSFDTIRLPFGLMGSRDDAGVLAIRLDETMESGWTENPVFEDTQQNAAAEAAVRDAFPTAIGTHQIPTPSGYPAYLALREHPAWYGLSFETKTRGQAGGRFAGEVLFKVHAARRLAFAGGKAVVFEVEPIRVVHRDESTEYLIDIPAADSAASAAEIGLSSMDILGARLGMPLDEALAAVKAAGFDSSAEIRVASDENALGNGIVLYREQGNDRPQLGLMTAEADGEERVVAIARYLPDHGAEIDQVVNSLQDKYGAPDGTFRYHSGTVQAAWGDGEATKKRIQADGTGLGCVLHPSRTMHLLSESAFSVNTYELEESCGTVLSTMVSEDLHMILVDTDFAAAAHTRFLAEKERRENQETSRKADGLKL